MSLPYPRNAMPIVQARQNGMKPKGMVIVVMTERYERLPADAHVFVDPGKSYRWDWVRGLPNVIVVIDAKTKFGRLLVDIQDAEPVQIDVVDVERRRGWLVCFADPLTTVRWPQFQVDDWLGDGQWHQDLADAKAEASARCEERRKEMNRWN